DDMHCYILCLTPAGKQLWLSPPMAGSFTWSQTIVLPEKHRKWRLIAAATYTAYPYRSDEGRLFILNGRTGKLLKPVADLGSSAIGFTAGDVLGDGETELIVGLRTGRIVVYDLQLRKRAQIENGSAISALDNADLDGDGKAEVIALTANMDMLIADFHPDYPSPRLQRIPLPGRYSRPSWLPGDNLKIGDFDGDSHPEALYSAHTIHEPALMVNYVAFYPMSPVEISPHRVIPYSGIKDFDWSPDGMRVVLLRSSNSTMKNNLLIGGINQKRLRCILNTGNITEVAWSPNNKYIAYIHKTTRSELAGIWIYDLHNNTSKVIVKDATAKQLVWSPDSTRIAFVSQRDGTEDIWLVDVRVKSKPY
ncbi:MAG TPA: hypothetical protein EYP10_15480, partial [Armatimonadetes bacterium]|nr:hypothetical protein [Armatimonadota bacterium]